MGVLENGYITKLETFMKQQSQTNYEVIGAGVGGNKVYDLYLRIDSDVLAKKPDIVVIYIGINDVWHKKSLGTGTDADKFEAFYRGIIKKLQAHSIKILLCTPSVIGEKPNCTNPLDGELNQYSFLIKKIAKDFQLPVCDLRTAFLHYEEQYNTSLLEKGVLTTDGVHLNNEGNTLVAKEMWKLIPSL
jgi:lysophospholipase L1-like esterase